MSTIDLTLDKKAMRRFKTLLKIAPMGDGRPQLERVQVMVRDRGITFVTADGFVLVAMQIEHDYHIESPVTFHVRAEDVLKVLRAKSTIAVEIEPEALLIDDHRLPRNDYQFFPTWQTLLSQSKEPSFSKAVFTEPVTEMYLDFRSGESKKSRAAWYFPAMMSYSIHDNDGARDLNLYVWKEANIHYLFAAMPLAVCTESYYEATESRGDEKWD